MSATGEGGRGVRTVNSLWDTDQDGEAGVCRMGGGVSAAQFARMLGRGGRAGLSHLPPQAGLHPDPELCGAQRVPAARAQGRASIREGACRSDF